MAGDEAATGLGTDAREVADAGRATARAAEATATALRDLVVADVALARHALGRAAALVAVAVALGASGWLFAMALLVFVLRAAGFGWLSAFAIPTALSLAGTALCAWLALRALAHSRLDATRRQIARLLESAASDAAAPAETEAAERAP